MKILSAAQIRDWDQATMRAQGLSSIELMERAAIACFRWMEAAGHLQDFQDFLVLCGKGNNGGDGLVIARLLRQRGLRVRVFTDTGAEKRSAEFSANLERYQEVNGPLDALAAFEAKLATRKTLIVDALLGSGLSREPQGDYARAISAINASAAHVVSVDLPSGLFADAPSTGEAIVEADETLSLQSWKYGFLLPSGSRFTGRVHILDIGLDRGFVNAVKTDREVADLRLIQQLYRPRKAGSHKGTYGHALLIAGSYGKMGAALMSARACLRTGAGLLTCHLPSVGYQTLQSGLPEAMVIADHNSSFNTRLDVDTGKYQAIGIGPGLGQASETKELLHHMLQGGTRPMIIDADALNILGTEPTWQKLIPAGSILTPHPKEFTRLFGEEPDEDRRVQLALTKAQELNVVIVLKGHHTLVATPAGRAWFNITGNAGMAKGGSGDALTGILLSLLCQGYSAEDAAILGVWLHGTAGDHAAKEFGTESMLATDLIECLGKAYRSIP